MEDCSARLVMGEEKNSERCPQGSANDSGKKNQAKCYCPCCYCPNCSVKKSIPDDEENMAVYETLRNEIISTQGMRTTLIVYMYTVYFAIVTFEAITSGRIEIENRIPYVVSLVVLVFFQSKIHRCAYTIARISAYIIVFFETDRKDIHWETVNCNRGVAKKEKNKIIEYLSGTGAPYLGILSGIGYWLEIKRPIYASRLDWGITAIFIICIIYLFLIHSDYNIDKDNEEKLEMIRSFRNYKS